MTSISSLTKEELSRWIAEKMEPLATVKWVADKSCLFWDSTGGWWKTYQGSFTQVATQPSPYDDPEIVMRLLKKERFIGVVQGFGSDYGKYSATFSSVAGTQVSGWCNSLERAIAEAFALANGLSRWQTDGMKCK